MNVTLKAVFVAILLWTVIAILVDHFIVKPFIPTLSTFMSVKLQFKWPIGYFNSPQIGLFTLLGIPLIVAGLRFLPWHPPRSKQNWIDGFEKWSRIIVWFFLAILFGVLGQIIYLGCKPIFPEGIRNIVEVFSLTADIKFGTFDFGQFSGSLTAILGLILGFYLFMSQGIKKTFIESSGMHNYLRHR